MILSDLNGADYIGKRENRPENSPVSGEDREIKSKTLVQNRFPYGMVELSKRA